MKIITDGIYSIAKYNFIYTSNNNNLTLSQMDVIDLLSFKLNGKLPKPPFKVSYWGTTGNKKQAHRFIFNSTAKRAMGQATALYGDKFKIINLKNEVRKC